MTTWSDLVFNPLWTGVKGIGDFWSIAFGSREQKANAVLDYVSFTGETPQSKAFVSKYKQVVLEQKQFSQTNKDYWGKTVLLNTDIAVPEMPDFGNIGKWALIGLLAIGGLYIAGQYISRK